MAAESQSNSAGTKRLQRRDPGDLAAVLLGLCPFHTKRECGRHDAILSSQAFLLGMSATVRALVLPYFNKATIFQVSANSVN